MAALHTAPEALLCTEALEAAVSQAQLCSKAMRNEHQTFFGSL